MNKYKFDLLAVTGPTASGKTAFAAHLCNVIDGEIISADSRQIYRHMNIGTGKDYADYIVNNRQIPYHLIDIAEPGYKYNIFEYKRDFIQAYADITSRGKMPVLCGGSGMYLNAATGRYNLYEVPHNTQLRKELEGKSLEELTALLAKLKKLHNKTDTDTIEHALRAIEIARFIPEKTVSEDTLPGETLFIGIRYDRNTERNRIAERLVKRLEAGLIKEVEGLLASGLQSGDLIYYGLEYKFVTNYITGLMSYDEMVSKLTTAIQQFAKRQMTWFRKMEKEGMVINWIDGSLTMEDKIKTALSLLDK